MPSLHTGAPAAVPLSVVKTSTVSSAIPHSSSFSISRPMFVSMFSIMPKNEATSARDGFPSAAMPAAASFGR